MEAMRDVLRGSLGRSLRTISTEDRLAAAWTVACGRVLAGRGTVTGYRGGVLEVRVVDPVWLAQMVSLRATLAREVAQASGVAVDRIEFSAPSSASGPRSDLK